MKAILISTRPEWVIKIITGIKKDEIRKGSSLYKAINKLIEEQGVAPMLLYCTKAKNKSDVILHYPNADIRQKNYKLNGKVVARFNATAEEIKQRIGVFWVWGGHPYYTDNVSEENLINRSCLSATELENYLQGKIGTAIHINDLVIFDKPKELWQFKTLANAKKYEKDLEQAYEEDAEISARLYEGIANDDECANCVELTELSEGYYGLQKPPQSWCYVEI